MPVVSGDMTGRFAAQFLLYGFIVSMVTGTAAAPGNKHALVQDIVSRYWSSIATSGLQPQSSSATNAFHADDAALARMLFRFVDLKDTKMADMLTSASMGAGDDDVTSPIELLRRKLTRERLLNFLRELQLDTNQPEVGQSSAEQWDDACYRDLTTFIEPITDALLNALPDDDDWLIIKAILRENYLRKPTDKEIPDWGLSMLDGFAKVPEALADGKLHWVGGYEMCNRQEVMYYYNMTAPAEDRSFKGKYCRIDISPRPEESNVSFVFTFGMCVPSSCSDENVTQFLSDDMTGRGSTRLLGLIQGLLQVRVEDIFCGHGALGLSDVPGAVAATIILIIIVVLVLLGTLWDGLFRPFWIRKSLETHAQTTSPTVGAAGEPETPPPQYETIQDINSANHQMALQRPLSVTSTSGLVPNGVNFRQDNYWQGPPGCLQRLDLFFVAFSAYSNIKKLFRVQPSGPQHLTAVDAVKYLSICYLILGQTYLLGPVVSFVLVTGNIISTLRTLPTQWNFMPILGFHHAIDSFFVCSGLLVTLFWFRRIEKNSGRLTPWLVVRNILHWYWRLMPTMMMVMMIFVVYYKFLANGPLAAKAIPFADNCRPNWWTNLLMIQNLVNLDKQCMAWTWYFSAVFQLHLVATIILSIYHFSPKGAIALIVAAFAAHFGATAAQSYDILKDGLIGSFRNWNRYMLITPWCHGSSYFIGMSLALILRRINFKHEMGMVLHITGWVLGVGLIVLVTYLPYDMYRDLDLQRWSRGVQVTYDTLSRTGWSLGVAWIIYACVTGNGGFIGEVMSWKAFQPLGRLTYSIYILHAIATFRYVYSRMTLLYVAENEMVYLFYGNLMMSHVYAFICCVLFEFPFKGLEMVLACRTKLEALLAGNHPQLTESRRQTACDIKMDLQKQESKERKELNTQL